MKIATVFSLSALLALAGFITPSTSSADSHYVTNAAAVVKAANWTRKKTVKVELMDFAYKPKDLTFKAGTPYKLVLTNTSPKLKHYFTAPEFFKAIATRKAQTSEAEIKAPYFNALEIMPAGARLELWFVAVKPGKYPVTCTIEGHAKKGMKGTITITK